MNNSDFKNGSKVSKDGKTSTFFTSTPCLKSSLGRKILRDIFFSNFPKDISMQEESPKEPTVDPVLIFKERINFSSPLDYKLPKEITPNTKKLIDENFNKSVKSKLNRRRIRL